MSRWQHMLGQHASDGTALSVTEVLSIEAAPTGALMEVAEAMTYAGFGRTISYSRKVFIPLTKLCRDVCNYRTFAKALRQLVQAYLCVD